MTTISQWFCSCCLPGWKEFSIVSGLLSTPKALPTHVSHLLKILSPDLPSLGSRTFPTIQPATSSIRPPALPSLGSRSISFFYNHTMLRWWVLYPKFIIMNFARPDIAFLSLQPSSVQINKDLGEFELIELIWTISMYISSILLLAQAARKGRIILIVPFILPAESKRAHLNVSSVLRICSQLTQAPWTLCLHPWCLLNVWTSWGCADGGAHHSHK